jgi:hypothetical protein
VEQQIVYTPEMRQGEWADFNIKVEPYSMARPDPNMAVRRRLEFATNVIPAAAQAFQTYSAPASRSARSSSGWRLKWGSRTPTSGWTTRRSRAGSFAGQPPMPGMPGQPGSGPPQPNQPVPSARGPNGGISTDTEQAMAQQEAAGELQGAYPSARALGLARG